MQFLHSENVKLKLCAHSKVKNVYVCAQLNDWAKFYFDIFKSFRIFSEEFEIEQFDSQNCNDMLPKIFRRFWAG